MQAAINPPIVLFWAIVRMILGLAQMTGAIVFAACLFKFGPTNETVLALSITAGVTVLSIVLFRVVKVQNRVARGLR
jgi:low affinity Fe/Cu permease